MDERPLYGHLVLKPQLGHYRQNFVLNKLLASLLNSISYFYGIEIKDFNGPFLCSFREVNGCKKIFYNNYFLSTSIGMLLRDLWTTHKIKFCYVGSVG